MCLYTQNIRRVGFEADSECPPATLNRYYFRNDNIVHLFDIPSTIEETNANNSWFASILYIAQLLLEMTFS